MEYDTRKRRKNSVALAILHVFLAISLLAVCALSFSVWELHKRLTIAEQETARLAASGVSAAAGSSIPDRDAVDSLPKLGVPVGHEYSRRLGGAMLNVEPRSSARADTGCVQIDIGMGSEVVDLDSLSCNGNRCPPCFIVIASNPSLYQLTLRYCSNMYVSSTKKLGTGNDYTNGLVRIAVINAASSDDVVVSDGSTSLTIAPNSFNDFICYAASSPLHRLMVPSITDIKNSLTVQGQLMVVGTLSVDQATTLVGAARVQAAFHVDDGIGSAGYAGTGITITDQGVLSTKGDLKMDGTLSVVQTSTLYGDTAVVGGTLSVAQTSTLVGNTEVDGTLLVKQTANVLDSFHVDDGTGSAGYAGSGITITNQGVLSAKGNLNTDGSLSVVQTSTLVGDTAHWGTLSVSQTSTLVGDTQVDRMLLVKQTAIFQDSLHVDDGTGSWGYAGSGITITNQGVLSAKGNLNTDGSLSVVQTSILFGDTAHWGTLSVAQTSTLVGNTQVDGTLLVKQTANVQDAFHVDDGTGSAGYAGTGITITDQGVLSTRGSLRVEGSSTLGAPFANSGSVEIFGGSGYSGVTITAGGAINADGAVADNLR